MTVSATDKPTRRPSSSAAKSAPNVLQTMAGLRPEHVAFLGEYRVDAQDKRIDVEILCWPTVSAAWSMLTQSLTMLQSLRGDDSNASLRMPIAPWLRDAAPQLCLPVREPNAAESTLATLIRRLPLRFAVAVVEHQSGQSAGSDALRYRSLFSGCLTAYGAYLKSTNQAACRIIIASPGNAADNDLRRAAYGEVLPHLDSAARLAALELGFWPQSTAPLPLEVAQLAAAAVGRHLEHPSQASPLFETVRAHLAPPSRFHALSRQKRRK
ncbi:hypothetical protein [Dyella sp.]|uniref:hypothetical protein n=1 Tax=Dyella sp. TaxID=1869338 RepID=UPI002D7A1F03|nr:hypothetical protein [Dyella sp.]HET7332222.1 hypothetical protein [Dyella sp.]